MPLFVAVADSVFPTLDPAREVLATIGANLQLAAQPTPDEILKIAEGADALLVTYAKITADMIGRMRGTVLGLVGFGRIPQLVAPKAQAFGLRVIASDPFVPADVFARAGVERVEFADVLKRSDYISIHAPLMPETRNLFSTDAFRQ